MILFSEPILKPFYSGRFGNLPEVQPVARFVMQLSAEITKSFAWHNAMVGNGTGPFIKRRHHHWQHRIASSNVTVLQRGPVVEVQWQRSSDLFTTRYHFMGLLVLSQFRAGFGENLEADFKQLLCSQITRKDHSGVLNFCELLGHSGAFKSNLKHSEAADSPIKMHLLDSETIANRRSSQATPKNSAVWPTMRVATQAATQCPVTKNFSLASFYNVHR